MRAWLGLKAGNEREGVTHLILLPSFENLGVFRCFYSNDSVISSFKIAASSLLWLAKQDIHT